MHQRRDTSTFVRMMSHFVKHAYFGMCLRFPRLRVLPIIAWILVVAGLFFYTCTVYPSVGLDNRIASLKPIYEAIPQAAIVVSPEDRAVAQNFWLNVGTDWAIYEPKDLPAIVGLAAPDRDEVNQKLLAATLVDAHLASHLVRRLPFVVQALLGLSPSRRHSTRELCERVLRQHNLPTACHAAATGLLLYLDAAPSTLSAESIDYLANQRDGLGPLNLLYLVPLTQRPLIFDRLVELHLSGEQFLTFDVTTTLGVKFDQGQWQRILDTAITTAPSAVHGISDKRNWFDLIDPVLELLDDDQTANLVDILFVQNGRLMTPLPLRLKTEIMRRTAQWSISELVELAENTFDDKPYLDGLTHSLDLFVARWVATWTESQFISRAVPLMNHLTDYDLWPLSFEAFDQRWQSLSAEQQISILEHLAQTIENHFRVVNADDRELEVELNLETLIDHFTWRLLEPTSGPIGAKRYRLLIKLLPYKINTDFDRSIAEYADDFCDSINNWIPTPDPLTAYETSRRLASFCILDESDDFIDKETLYVTLSRLASQITPSAAERLLRLFLSVDNKLAYDEADVYISSLVQRLSFTDRDRLTSELLLLLTQERDTIEQANLVIVLHQLFRLNLQRDVNPFINRLTTKLRATTSKTIREQIGRVVVQLMPRIDEKCRTDLADWLLKPGVSDRAHDELMVRVDLAQALWQNWSVDKKSDFFTRCVQGLNSAPYDKTASVFGQLLATLTPPPTIDHFAKLCALIKNKAAIRNIFLYKERLADYLIEYASIDFVCSNWSTIRNTLFSVNTYYYYHTSIDAIKKLSWQNQQRLLQQESLYFRIRSDKTRFDSVFLNLYGSMPPDARRPWAAYRIHHVLTGIKYHASLRRDDISGDLANIDSIETLADFLRSPTCVCEVQEAVLWRLEQLAFPTETAAIKRLATAPDGKVDDVQYQFVKRWHRRFRTIASAAAWLAESHPEIDLEAPAPQSSREKR